MKIAGKSWRGRAAPYQLRLQCPVHKDTVRSDAGTSNDKYDSQGGEYLRLVLQRVLQPGT